MTVEDRAASSDREAWEYSIESLARGLHTLLVAVVECVGSVPGRPGARMVVSSEGTRGTVGGGVAEKEMIDRALAWSGPGGLCEIEHSGSGPDPACAGRQTFAVLPLTDRDRPVLSRIASTVADSRFGALRLSPAGPSFTVGQRIVASFERGRGSWLYSETIGPVETLFLIGGGHVSLALSRVMATLPFRIVVLDNRAGLPTMERNAFAHHLEVVSYHRVADHVADGDLSYAVIMTHGHEHDGEVLGHLVDKPLRYLGMLGSQSKVRQIYCDLVDRGVAPERLEMVHAPVGVLVGSHTPEEIAVSIAAELIRVRNLGS